MTPINSTLPSFAALDAQTASADADDTNTQADEFSAMLGSLIVPVGPPTQPCQPTPVEAQNTSGAGVESITSPAAAQAQSYGFFVPNGTLSDDNAGAASAGSVNLNTIFGKLGVDQNSQLDQELPALPGTEAGLSDKLNPDGNAATELPSQPQAGSELVGTKLASTDKKSITVEVPKMTTGSAVWRMHHLFDLDYSPSRGISATFAATINSLREPGEAQGDNQNQSEIAGTKTDASPLAAELFQGTVSSETGTQAGTSDSSAKDSIAPETAIESSPKSDKTRSTESQFLAEAAPALNAAASHVAGQETTSQTTQSVAAQVSHAMAQVAGEVLVHREPRSIRIRLRPEDLGEVQISLTTDAHGHLSAQISAEHETTRRAIAGGLDHLRETLEQAGINVDQLNVNVNQYTSSGTGAQSDAGSQQAARQSAIAAHTTSSLTENLSEGKSSREEDRLLSMRA